MNDVSVYIDKNLRYDESLCLYDKYPEFHSCQFISNTSNHLYNAIRNVLHNLGLDSDNYGTENWNPLGDIINPGNKVVIKPNLVLHCNGKSPNIDAVVTNAAVIKPIIDYTLLALKDSGEIVIADAPQANADFEKIVQRNGLEKLVSSYKNCGISISLIDLRKNKYIGGFDTGIRQELLGDPKGYILCDLAEKSFLNHIDNMDKLYGSDYDRKFIVGQHTNHHNYLFSKTVLDADVVINIPKMKTHRKAGVTLNSKNMVGANGDKNYLAHFRVGSGKQGGDEFPNEMVLPGIIHYKWVRYASDHILIKNTKLSRRIYRLLNLPFAGLHLLYKIITGTDYYIGHGDWYGNDTVWRMCLDLNQILLYCDNQGLIHDFPQRKYFCLVDGIIAGESDGPLHPKEKNVGYLACGFNPFLVDYICAYHMGFDPLKIPVIKNAMLSPVFSYDINDINVLCVDNNKVIDYRNVNMRFCAQDNWKGHIER